jgi:multiple sugar transport system permease protein
MKIWMKHIKTYAWVIFRTCLLIGMSYVMLYPLLYMLSNAFKPAEQAYDPSVIWIPKSLTLANFVDAVKAMKYGSTFINTMFVSVVSSLLGMITCLMAGYGFARFKFKERNLLFLLVILTLIIPPQTTMIPTYMQLRYFDGFGILKLINLITGGNIHINLIDSVWSMYLPAILGMGIRSGLYIFIFRQFFRGMPKELEDAALIDGCGVHGTFWRIMVPNAGAALLTVFLFSIVWYWNDYYYASMYMPGHPTMSVMLSRIRDALTAVAAGETGISSGGNDLYTYMTRIQAASLLAIAPLLALYTVAQKYFVESIDRTGIVG